MGMLVSPAVETWCQVKVASDKQSCATFTPHHPAVCSVLWYIIQYIIYSILLPWTIPFQAKQGEALKMGVEDAG